MALTPNVVDGQIILASWGNQIRDRTVQQFVSITELKTWAPADGSVGIVAGRLYERSGGFWTTTTFVNFQKASSGGYINYALADTGGLTKITQAIVFPRRAPDNTTFIVGPAVAPDGLSGSIRCYFVNPTTFVIATVGDGTSIYFDCMFTGTV